MGYIKSKIKLNLKLLIGAAALLTMTVHGCSYFEPGASQKGTAGGVKAPTEASAPSAAEQAIEVTDDVGRQVKLSQPAKRIISLYSAHTENLFSLGLRDEIIGVSTSETLPEVKGKPSFDYRADAEKIIAAKPDLVLIRNFIYDRHPDFVKKLEQVGIPVAVLYPESLDDFYGNLLKLGRLAGKNQEAQQLIDQMKSRLEKFDQIAKSIPEDKRKRVFLESSKDSIKTVTTDSLAALVLRKAGAINVAEDAQAIKAGSSIAPYGEERLLAQASKIDVYLAQQGVMNSVTEQEIYERPGFHVIKAIKERQVLLLNEDQISRPTLRLITGIELVGRYLYPEFYK